MCGRWGVCLCDHHITVSRTPQQVYVPRLEVQTPIRKRDRRCREGKKRRHNTRTHGQEGGGVASHDMLYCTSIAFFSRPELGVICMTDDDFVRVVATKGKGKEEKRRRKKFVIGEKLIRIIFDQSTILPNFLRATQKNSFLSFLFLLIGRDHPPTRPGRSSTPIFILRTATGTLWEGPGDLSHCLPVISGPPARKNFSSSFRVKYETRCAFVHSTVHCNTYSGIKMW